jgi:cell division protein FtsB
MRRYLIPALLTLLLVVLQAQLWFGRGSLPDVWSLERMFSVLSQSNEAATQRNAQIANETRDLQNGLEVIEAQARSELGMVKPNEVFIQYAEPPATAKTDSSAP